MNPNTVVRAYRELEYDGIARERTRGPGTFISDQEDAAGRGDERQRAACAQIVSDAVARAGAADLQCRIFWIS